MAKFFPANKYYTTLVKKMQQLSVNFHHIITRSRQLFIITKKTFSFFKLKFT